MVTLIYDLFLPVVSSLDLNDKVHEVELMFILLFSSILMIIRIFVVSIVYVRCSLLLLGFGCLAVESLILVLLAVFFLFLGIVTIGLSSPSFSISMHCQL
jgi:hypothetical protein